MGTQNKSAPPLILTFNGRSASCTIHVLLINGTDVSSPEFMVGDFSFLRDWGNSDISDIVRGVCIGAQIESGRRMADYGLWSHAIEEWKRPHLPTEAGHDKCSCIRESNRTLFHAHNLLVDRRIFRNFAVSCATSLSRPTIIVASREHRSAVLNYYKTLQGNGWHSDYLNLVYAAYSQLVSYQNMNVLSNKFDLIEISLEKLHADFDQEIATVFEKIDFEPAKAIQTANNLILQGLDWRGGVPTPLFDSSKLMGYEYQERTRRMENLISSFDPTAKNFNSARNRFRRQRHLFFADLTAFALLPWFISLGKSPNAFQMWAKDHHEPIILGKRRGGLIGRFLNFFLCIPTLPYFILRFIGRFSFARTRKLLSKL